MIIDIANPADVEIFRDAVKGKTVGLTSGCWDLFHHLHLVYLQRCRRMCDILIVGVDSDDLVKKDKGPHRPIIPEHQRVAMVNSQTCVHMAFIMGSVADFGKTVESFGIDVIFKNNAFEHEKVAGSEHARVEIVHDINQPDSTSAIIDEIIRRGIQSRGQNPSKTDGKT